MSTASIIRIEQSFSAKLADTAVWALREEALLTPKPALVDQRGSGAHSDLNLDLMLRSAISLHACFEAMAEAAQRLTISQSLREMLALIGRDGEVTMLEATGGSNSHRGAIWSLGLLIAASTHAHGARNIARTAGLIASFQDRAAPLTNSNGKLACAKFNVSGARGQAMRGFPHVMNFGLPALRFARQNGCSENNARIDSLLALMGELDDTCILHRGGAEALVFAQTRARELLAGGGSSTKLGLTLLRELDEGLRKRNASPGGSADLLACVLYLDRLDFLNGSSHGEV